MRWRNSVGAGVLALLLGLSPSWVQAAITCTTTDFVSNTATTSTTLVITITVPTATYRTSVITVTETTDETTTISSITDPNGGTWTVKSGPYDMSTAAVARIWFAERTGGSAGSTTITVTFSAAVNSDGQAGTCTSDTAALTYVSSAAYFEMTPNTTVWQTNTRTCTTTCAIFGNMGHSSGNSVISSVGTNQTALPNGNSLKSHLVVRKETSGTFSLDATMSFVCGGMWGAHLYQEAATASANFFPRRLQVQP